MAIRTVKGREYDTGGFVRLIGDTIIRLGGEASPSEVVDAWDDPEWLTIEGRHEVNRRMYALSQGKKQVLQKAGYGRYRTNPNSLHGRTVNDAWGSAICDWLMENGGVATVTEAREAFGVGPRKGSLREERFMSRRGKFKLKIKRLEFAVRPDDGESSQFSKALASSHLIRRDFRAHNCINVPYPLLDTLVQEGWVARMTIWRAVALTDLSGNAQGRGRIADQLTAEYFRRVGATYAAGRQRIEIGYRELMQDPALAAEVEEMCEAHPYRQGFLDYMAEVAQGRRPPLDNRPEVFEDAETAEDFGLVVMSLFDEGDPDTHEVARTGFHRAYSAALDLDPVAMSRGLLRAKQKDEAEVELGEVMKAGGVEFAPKPTTPDSLQ